MNIKELLGKDAKELEGLTDAQLLEYFSPYMKFIIPVETKDETKKGISVNSSGGTPRNYTATNEAQKTMDMAQRLAKQMGIKI